MWVDIATTHIFGQHTSVLHDGLRSSLKAEILLKNELAQRESKKSVADFKTLWKKVVTEAAFLRISLPFPALRARGQFWKEHPNIVKIQLL